MKFNKTVLSVILSVFMLSDQVYASEAPKDNVRNLFISIQNLGSENCQLIENTISSGKLLYSNIPSILDATGERFEFILHGNTVELTLKYNCGAHKTFSIYMKQYLKKGHRQTGIDSTMFNAVDVFETHKVVPGVHICDSDGVGISCYSKAGKINWTITH